MIKDMGQADLNTGQTKGNEQGKPQERVEADAKLILIFCEGRLPPLRVSNFHCLRLTCQIYLRTWTILHFLTFTSTSSVLGVTTCQQLQHSTMTLKDLYQAAKDGKGRKIVVAVDYGTTYSGLAWAQTARVRTKQTQNSVHY